MRALKAAGLAKAYRDSRRSALDGTGLGDESGQVPLLCVPLKVRSRGS